VAKKETLAVNALLVMLTGMSLDEAAEIWAKDGEEAAQKAMMEGAAKKRREGDLMSFENMMGKPKEKAEQKKEDTKEETFICPLCEEEKRISCRVLKGCCRSCSSYDV
jgi:hypothetical protein